mmetsp:Transcript_58058/g.189001  ORF Transcript_58058/g.189001 Transcript_58058/m.189001 type:complete len:292 (+) Transcript_58058:216-1091(+)
MFFFKLSRQPEMLTPRHTEEGQGNCVRSCSFWKSGRHKYCMKPFVKACSAMTVEFLSKPAGGEINSPNSASSRSPWSWNSRCTRRFHFTHCGKGSVGLPMSAAWRKSSMMNSSWYNLSHIARCSSSAVAGGLAGQCHGTATDSPSCSRLSMSAANRVIVSACFAMSVPNMARTSGFRIAITSSLCRKPVLSCVSSWKVMAQCMFSSGDWSLYFKDNSMSASSSGGVIGESHSPSMLAFERKAGVRPGWCTSWTSPAKTMVNSMYSWVNASPHPAQKEYTHLATEAPWRLLW